MKIGLLTAAFFGALLLTGMAHAAAPFYQGKTMRIVVGAAPGGGFDTYSRTIARHMGKYIPGHPAIIVENMPGAGFVVAVNHLMDSSAQRNLTG